MVDLALLLIASRESQRFEDAVPEPFPYPSASGASSAQPKPSARHDAKAILHLRTVWWLSLVYFCNLRAMLKASGWVDEYLVWIRHCSLTSVGSVLVGLSSGIFLGQLLLAKPTSRFGSGALLRSALSRHSHCASVLVSPQHICR